MKQNMKKVCLVSLTCCDVCKLILENLDSAPPAYAEPPSYQPEPAHVDAPAHEAAPAGKLPQACTCNIAQLER